MKRQFQAYIAFIFVVLCCAWVGIQYADADHPTLANGDVAPNFSLPDTENRTVTLSNHEGSENVVLVFYRGRW